MNSNWLPWFHSEPGHCRYVDGASGDVSAICRCLLAATHEETDRHQTDEAGTPGGYHLLARLLTPKVRFHPLLAMRWLKHTTVLLWYYFVLLRTNISLYVIMCKAQVMNNDAANMKQMVTFGPIFVLIRKLLPFLKWQEVHWQMWNMKKETISQSYVYYHMQENYSDHLDSVRGRDSQLAPFNRMMYAQG